MMMLHKGFWRKGWEEINGIWGVEGWSFLFSPRAKRNNNPHNQKKSRSGGFFEVLICNFSWWRLSAKRGRKKVYIASKRSAKIRT